MASYLEELDDAIRSGTPESRERALWHATDLLMVGRSTDEEIWVNAVAPSVLDTAANRAAMPDADPSRWVSPADLAEIITFLASPDNRATRGAVIPVYAGS